MKAELEIFPRALVTAARTFNDRPQIVGEVLTVLCGCAHKVKLTEVQRYIIDECNAEIAERVARRGRLAELKRRQRMGAGSAKLESRPVGRAAKAKGGK